MAGNFTDKSQGTVQAGQLRRVLTFQQPALTPDGNAGATEDFTTILVTRGALQTWKATDMQVGEQIVPVVWAKFIIRYRPSTTFTAGMRLIDGDPNGSGGTTYTIIGAVDPDGTKRQIHITAQQIVHGT